MLDLRIATYLAIALFFIRKAMKKAHQPPPKEKKPTPAKATEDLLKKYGDLAPLPKCLQNIVGQLQNDCECAELKGVIDHETMLKLKGEIDKIQARAMHEIIYGGPTAEEEKTAIAVDVQKLYADRHAKKQELLAAQREDMEAARKCLSSIKISE